MKQILFFSLPLLLLTIGCSENNSTEPTTQTDAELKAKIVGTWYTYYVKINFEANGNFTQNIDVDYSHGDSIINETDDIKGTYDIVDGILRYTNITEWKRNEHFFGGGQISPDYKIIMVKNYLYMYAFNRLIRIGDNSDSLWGEWYTYDWTYHYLAPDLFSKAEETYSFNRDSMMVTIGFRYPFDSSAVFDYYTYPLTYSPPEISWDNYNTWIVEFHDSQIWMGHKRSRPLTPYIKEK